MRRIGDHRAGDARVLAAQCHTPGNRAAPVVPDDGEMRDAQRIGQQEHIADQLVGGVGGDFLRLGRGAIAALVWRDAAEPVLEMRDLVPPRAVALGKAVQEDQHRRIHRPFIDDVEVDAVGQGHALQFESHQPCSSLSM